MNISTFIEETLLNIKKGIQEANKKENGSFFVMMMNDKIDFDMAVIISDKQGGKGEAKIGVAHLAVASGDISVENENSRTSRIKFSIKIKFNEFGGNYSK